MSEPNQLSYAQAASLYETLAARAAARRAVPVTRRARLRFPRLRLVHVLAAGSAITAVAVAVLLVALGNPSHAPRTSTTRGTSSPPGPDALGRLPVPVGSNPLPGGRKVSLHDASRLLGSPVPVPDTDLANGHTLSVIWAIPGEVMLDYVKPQIWVRIVPANRILRHGALKAFKQEAKGLHMSPGAMLVGGKPALVVGGGATRPGFAEVVRDGLDIAVMGHRSADNLIAIARSLSTEHANH
jgi:hypothetical protein